MGSKININKVSSLARIQLTDEEKVSLSADLEKIVSYVEKLSELDTSSVEATSHVLNLEDVYRKDKVESSDAAAKVLNVLPESRKHETFFKVPKVIDN